ncbi:MAG: RIP metalloprotease RseP [Candidatus Portnoybacteria bacterium RBG_13_40_8]|uniref:Zinc metalloprotease n=1 Tax=Candidatus Portnoybacteria bacterium RBG_13_40_8 TaxID=1801990 RepID=A0A1G2F2N0_9BACT|nr:MAG: RIP metalloprotease RseP [Candidatus Portnoybacteria bacterium RBG_13_40_8]OGZ34549.1 MAG: RIP metalloprotease RseP [Candidatus Portnoybacteria bacterium RIFCSPHIGHO2_01_FULL_39_19]
MILTIIVFILILGILVFAHELGHFISAKKAGVRVDEFGFGFPPRLFAFKKGETTYSLNLIPIGGFVKIFGEEQEEKRSKSKRAFYNRPAWQRAIILFAGVFMNFLIAAVFLSIVHGLGVPSLIERGQEQGFRNIQIQIIEVAKDSPAEKAGLKIGDTIHGLSFRSEVIEVKEVEDVQNFIAGHIGEELNFSLKRGNETFEKIIIPRANPPLGEGATGIAMAKTGLISYPWYKAILKGFETAGRMLVTMITMFYLLIKTLILKGTMIGEVAGPVGIYSLTSQFVKLGLIYVLQFAAFLSLNLAIINAIPFPALDGGRLLFLLIEKIKGKPINMRTEKLAHTIGFALLILLIIVITFRDVIKLF